MVDVMPRRRMCDGRRMRVLGLVSAAIAVALVVAPGRAAADEPAAPPPPPAAAPVDDDAIERARQQVLDHDYQPELPRYAGSGAAGLAGLPQRRAGGELEDAERRRAMLDTRAQPEGGSSLMSMVMWVLLFVIGVLVASWLASELSRYGGDAELEPEPDVQGRMQAASAAIIERPLGDADELARRGQYAEAIHTLLLRTLQELARSAAVRVGPATTSREILARVPLLADARTALAGLIIAVEITHFGAEPASAADYERCREQFHVFAAAFRGAGRGALAA
jgi:hypothetical protein